MSKRYCVRGHDTERLGRYKQGHCAACERIRAGNREPGLRYLPIEPLRNAIRLRLDDYAEYRILGASNANSAAYKLSREFADRFGGDPYTARRQLERILHVNKTVHEEQADRWCAVLGLHLDMLWDPYEVRV